MPKKKGDHDGPPLPSAVDEGDHKKQPKDPLDSAVEVPAGVLPPDKPKP